MDGDKYPLGTIEANGRLYVKIMGNYIPTEQTGKEVADKFQSLKESAQKQAYESGIQIGELTADVQSLQKQIDTAITLMLSEKRGKEAHELSLEVVNILHPLARPKSKEPI